MMMGVDDGRSYGYDIVDYDDNQLLPPPHAHGSFISHNNESSHHYYPRGSGGVVSNHNAAATATIDNNYDDVHARGGGGIGAGAGVIADSDAFASDADKLSAILKCSDVEMHKHLLAVDFFRHRHRRLFAPTVFFGLCIAVGGFVSASDALAESQQQLPQQQQQPPHVIMVRDTSLDNFLILLVSSLGVLVVLLVILMNGLNYSSRAKFHLAAAEDLAQLSEKVRSYRMERAMDERAEDERDELRELFFDDDDDDGDRTADETDVDEYYGDDGYNHDYYDHHADDVERQLHQLRSEGRIVARYSGANNPAAAQAMIKAKVRASKKQQRRQAKLTQTLVKQRIRQAREEQDSSRDAITFNGYHAELNQIARGCRSDVPPRISKFFDIMENRVELMSLSRLGVAEDSRARRNQVLRMCAIEIYNEVSGSFFWPLWTPNVDRTVEAALKRVGQLLNLKYRARRRCKLIPCCPIPLCCKKKTSDNVFAIINEGIDQRELDMMQAERAALIRMEKEGRARRNAVPEKVLEMRDTFYSEAVSKNTNNKKRNGAGGALIRMPNDNLSTDRSIDPDGHSSRMLLTNAETGRSFRGGGGTHSSHRRSVEGRGGMYPQDREGYMMDYEDDLTEDEDATYQFYDEDDVEAEAKAKAKRKEKKKKKKAKKKKRKSKKKDNKGEDEEEEEEEEVNMEVEFQETATDGFSLYSELEMSEKD